MRKSEHPSDSEISEGTENEHQQLLEPEQPVLGFKKFGLRLSHGYSPVNAIVYLFGVFLTISIFVFLNSTQGFVLKDILEVPTTELGNTSGTLVFYDELTSLLVVALWGVISDLVGKYLVFGFGFTILSLAVGLFTFSSTVYPELLAYRILYALGGAAASAMLTAILADIAYEKDKSKFAGLVGLSSGLGALLGVFVFLPLPTRFSNAVNGLRSTYLIVAGIAIFGAVLFYSTAVSLLMKREASQENIRNSQPQAAPQSTWIKLFTSVKDGIKAAKNPTIFLGYAGNFLARSDSVSITLFLPLWVYRFYLDNGLCSGFDLNDPSLAREACRGAYTRASILSGVTQVFALIGAPVFGNLY